MDTAGNFIINVKKIRDRGKQIRQQETSTTPRIQKRSMLEDILIAPRGRYQSKEGRHSAVMRNKTISKFQTAAGIVQRATVVRKDGLQQPYTGEDQVMSGEVKSQSCMSPSPKQNLINESLTDQKHERKNDQIQVDNLDSSVTEETTLKQD